MRTRELGNDHVSHDPSDSVATMALRFSRIVLAWIGLLVVAISCSSEETTPDEDLTPARGLVTAANGGTIRTPSGIVLEVPPGAVAADVEVTVFPLDTARATATPSFVQGARFEPDGLALKKAATLTLPLKVAATTPPLELVFNGNDPNRAIASGDVAELSADGRAATLRVWHFSGAICATNCHGGTREFLTPKLSARGTDLTKCVTARYPESLPARCEDLHSDESIQAILDTFFDEVSGCCDEGQDISASQIQAIVDAVNRGRNVVVAFNKRAFPPRSGKHGFYPFMAHTATIEIVGGVPKLRNTVVVPTAQGSEVLAKLGGTNLVYWPLADINAFRRLKAAEGLEIAACNSPGCLGNDRGGPYAPLAERPEPPWSAVRLYVEREKPTCTSDDAGTDAGKPDQCRAEARPNGSCGGTGGGANCVGTVQPCSDPTGDTCCPADMCAATIGCVQIKCPTGTTGRTGFCACTCNNSPTPIDVHDECFTLRVCRCVSTDAGLNPPPENCKP